MGLNKVTITDIRAIKFESASHRVHHSFHGEAHKRFADASVGHHRTQISDHRVAFVGDRANSVTIGDVAQHEQVMSPGKVDAGALVFDVAKFYPQYRAIDFDRGAH